MEKEKEAPHPLADGAVAAAPHPRARLGDEHGSASVYRVSALEKGKLRPWSIQPWGLSLFLLTRPMNSTTFIPGNLDSESAMERVLWILMELNAYSNLFVRVRVNQARTATHFTGVNARRRFFC